MWNIKYKLTFNIPSLSNIVTSVDTNVPIKGNGKALSMTKGNGNSYYPFGVGNGEGRMFIVNSSQLNAGDSIAPYSGVYGNCALGLSTDASKSGIVGTVTRTQINCKFVIKF